MEKRDILTKRVSVLHQFRHENEAWGRVIRFLTDEYIILKNRLSEILQIMDVNDKALLERIEYFQNHFLKEDEIIGYLRMEIRDLNKLLAQDSVENSDPFKEIKKKQKKLRVELEKTEQTFTKFKYEFNNYVSDGV
jgi:hypothetical protein